MHVPIETVAFLVWDERLGRRLKRLRGKQSQKTIAAKIRQSGLSCSKGYVVSLEKAEVSVISPAMLMTIVKVLGDDFLTFLIHSQ